MTEDSSAIDVVRSSRDGHQFHEAWAARIALELLPPGTSLQALAIEGFSFEEGSAVSNAAHEIADLVRYRGGKNLTSATGIETLQFKYSVGAATVPMRASEMAKTLRKFAAADKDILARRPAQPDIATYTLVTNRPIDPDTVTALDAVRSGAALEGRAARHATQLTDAIGLEDEALRAFARRLMLVGTGETLGSVEHANLRTLACWAGATDNMGRARLSNLRKLVRDRSGSRGQGDNVIGRVDILGALDVAHENELYPVRAAFPSIETPIERPILEQLVAEVFGGPKALLVHAAGGVGKTVLMQSLANRLGDTHCVLHFDGFGAGMWREPSDSRHLPRKALPHLANLLAADGICDILLQASFSEDSLAAFRERLGVAVAALRAFRPAASIVLILDAIDHCGMQAERTQTASFAHLLLQSVNVAPIEGVRVVASCRTHRRHYAQGEALCREFEVPVFTRTETERLVLARHPSASQIDVTALQRRSGGNPRLLDNLLRRGPPFDQAGPDAGADSLEALLREQIDAAQERAIERGATVAEARGLLTGMALLPPPVPAGELAAALGLSLSNIDSFVADLFPLIEPTSTGLIFRDEPTETLVVEMISADAAARSALVARLQVRQDISIYAARALPGILIEVGEIDELVALAFAALDRADLSRVARRGIRLARVTAAAIACAAQGRVDDLTKIAVEAARISSATERSDAYIRAHPDLVALSGDAEAVRRFRDDRSGWAGSRHAALGVLDAFSGDMDSAALESDRALTWFNWWIREQREKQSQDRRDVETVEANAIFVQLLLGKAVRVDRFLAKLKDPYAFSLASTMLKLVAANARLSAEDNAAAAMIAALPLCRTKSPAVMAAITKRIDLPTDAKRRVLLRLAALPVATPDPRHYWDHRREDAFADAVIGAAGQAVGLGLHREAQAMVRHAPGQVLRAHDVTDPWPLSGIIARRLKLVAIGAAARHRPTRLTDVLPEEMRDLVPEAIRRRGPVAFERRLRQVLAKAKGERPKRDNASVTADDARKWEQMLDHRLGPLVGFVDLISEILKSPLPTPAIKAALAAASQLIAAAENYPYQDQSRFRRQLLFELVRWAAGCRVPLDREASQALATFFETQNSQVVNEWLKTIALLGRQPAGHAAALRLAKRAEAVVAADTSVTEQIQNYGSLARLLLSISADEARPYFRIGLELADAVGSDDQERIGDFIAFAAQYEGEPLAPETVHQFVRLCELNFPDESEALDWRAFTRALVAIGGASSLGSLGRLGDREKADLGWTLPPFLKALVERGQLAAQTAAGLIGLAEFRSTWNWFSPAMAKPILSQLAGPQRECFAEQLMIELDRTDAAQIHSEELKGFKDLFDAELPIHSRSRRRIDALHAEWCRRNLAQATTPRERATSLPDALRDASTITAELLRAALEETAAGYQGSRPTAGFLLKGYVEEIVDPAPRASLLKTVVADESFTFRDKVAALEAMREHWLGQSRALDEEIEAAAIAVALRSLDTLVRSGDTWSRPLSRIAGAAGERQHELVTAVIAALAGQSLEVSSDFWMSCAIILAKSASGKAIGDALSRYAATATASLPETIGDGPWSDKFAVEDDPDTLVADLLWLRLGAPEAANRWRAAHAVRRLLATSGEKILARLIDGIDRIDAGAFQDRTLPFFHMNARMWLLIALARIANDHPAEIAPHRAKLEAIASSETFPHVLCRHFAVTALRALVDAGQIADRENYRNWLATLNRPALPPAKRNEARPDFYSMRPKDRPEPQPPFRFEYDFDKYQVDPVGRVFGLPKWDVEDAAVAWIRRYDDKIEHMWECPRPRWSNEERPWGSATYPDVDLYGGQLGWHAVMLTAGQFAKEHLVRGDSWESTPWESWLDDKILSRPDGLWLADGTDWFPPEYRHAIVEAANGDEKVHVPRHPLDLLWLAGFDDTLICPDRFVVSASWESNDGLDISVGSQIVSAADARAVAHAVYSADPFFAYLPIDQSEDDEVDRRHPRERSLLTRWLRGDGHSYAKLDANDPYGFHTALQRAQPNAWTIERMGLGRSDPFGRAWADSAGKTAFQAEAWGTRRGRGRHRTDRGGTRLFAARESVLSLLGAENRALLILIKVRKYLEKKAEDDSFRHQMLALIVRPGEPVEIVWSVPKPLRSAIATLGHYERGEFVDRLAAVERLGVPRRQGWPRSRHRSVAGNGPS